MEQGKENIPQENSIISNPKRTRKKKLKIILISLLILFILFRILLPYIVLKYVNKKLSSLTEYYGHVEDIDIALIRGAYVIKDIQLVKLGNDGGKKDTIPFFRSTVIDLSVQWKAIFKGSLVGEIYVENPVINFVKGEHKNEDAKADTADFRQLIKDLMPLTVNHFEIDNGEIHYIDQFSTPRLNIALKELKIVATNLSNVNDSNKILPAHAVARGAAYDGIFTLNIDFDALKKTPTFDMNAEITHMNMVLLNDFLKAYGNFEVKKGSFGLYTEFAGKEGNFGGYVKPIIKDVEIKKGGKFKDLIYENIIAGAAKLLNNSDKDQIATKIDIKGKFEDPSINLWRAISFVLRNAFIRALKPTIDNTINIHQLDDAKNKTFLEKIFGSGKKKEGTGKDKKKTNDKQKSK